MDSDAVPIVFIGDSQSRYRGSLGCGNAQLPYQDSQWYCSTTIVKVDSLGFYRFLHRGKASQHYSDQLPLAVEVSCGRRHHKKGKEV